MAIAAIHKGTGNLLAAINNRQLISLLIDRNDCLESEKYGLIDENNALSVENAKLRMELAQQHSEVA